MSTCGYARVSTTDQDLTVQLEQLQAAGAEKVFSEQISGSESNRPALRDCLDWIREGDILIVTRLDRLGRSMNDLLKTLEIIRDKGAAFQCLQQNVDTTTSEGRLMFGLLAAFAEFELDIRRERQAEGIAKAKAAGVYSRKRKPKVPVEEIHRLLTAGWGPSAIAKKLKISRSTVTRNTPAELKNEQTPALARLQEQRKHDRHLELRGDL
jgi:DNA invertase Pin-like site-specific DNA recombinase